MSQPKISIVLPAYNAEETIKRCIDSILSQTYNGWELVVMDDGSKDNTGAICDSYADSDERIQVYHIENGGVSHARNIGLTKVTGEFVVFIDSDDWFDSGFLATMLEYAEFDFVVCGYERHNVWPGIIIPESEKIIRIGPDLLPEWNRSMSGFLYWYVWGKLFRTSIIRNHGLRFSEDMFYNEDFCFVVEYLSHAEDIKIIREHLVHHINSKARMDKYKMSASQFVQHVNEQEKSFSLLEKRCSGTLIEVRQDIYYRMFKCYASFLKTNCTLSDFWINAGLLRKDEVLSPTLRRTFMTMGWPGKRYLCMLYLLMWFPLISTCLFQIYKQK